MTETLRRRFRDMGERFQRSAVIAGNNGRIKESRRMYLSAAREFLRLAADLESSMQDVWLKRADKMEAAARDICDIDNREAVSEFPEEKVNADSLTLDDVAGLADVKQAVMTRIIYPFQHPEVSRRFHKDPGGGILMFGPPGVGKTMIAKAVAGEIGAGFFSVGCSDIFSKYVGETEKNMRKVFAQTAECERAVLFLDEVEALLGRRGNERSPVLDRLVPEFLSLTDGVGRGDRKLLLLAATNRPWDIDVAALREGRFGQLIYVGLPDRIARRFILQQNLVDVPVSDNMSLDELADSLTGYSGADIAGLCREATDYPYLREIENGEPQILTMDDFEKAMATARPSVTESMLEEYKKFASSRGFKL